MSKKRWSSVNFLVSVVVILVAVFLFTSGRDGTDKTPAVKTTVNAPKETAIESKTPAPDRIEPLAGVPIEILNSRTPNIGQTANGTPLGAQLNPNGELPADMPPEMAAQLKGPPPELPDDLKRQLEGPPPELPDDLKAQLNAPPPPIPDDIKRALATPPRVVSIDEVNGTGEGRQ